MAISLQGIKNSNELYDSYEQTQKDRQFAINDSTRAALMEKAANVFGSNLLYTPDLWYKNGAKFGTGMNPKIEGSDDPYLFIKLDNTLEPTPDLLQVRMFFPAMTNANTLSHRVYINELGKTNNYVLCGAYKANGYAQNTLNSLGNYYFTEFPVRGGGYRRTQLGACKNEYLWIDVWLDQAIQYYKLTFPVVISAHSMYKISGSNGYYSNVAVITNLNLMYNPK